jgi:hypothetical protein
MFSDPTQMHSHLMIRCRDSLPTLSSLMSHSFAKAVLRTRDFVNELTGENWSTQEVWDRYITARVQNVFTSNTKAEITWLRNKGKVKPESTLSAENLTVQHRFSSL